MEGRLKLSSCTVAFSGVSGVDTSRFAMKWVVSRKYSRKVQHMWNSNLS